MNITYNLPQKYSAFSLFIGLISGKLTPHRHWQNRHFRIRFLLRSIVFPVTTFRFLNAISTLPEMQIAFRRQGILPAKIHRPYLRSGVSVQARSCAIIDHYQFIQSLKNLALRCIFQEKTATTLAVLTGKNGETVEISCCPGLFDREGEMTLVLRYNSILISSLSFSVIQHQGLSSILIGGLQGPQKNIGHDIIREATKTCSGLFPKRILVEALVILAEQCEIKKIMAVGDKSHVFHSLRYRHSKKDTFLASYSEFWASLYGERTPDNLYIIPVTIPRKSLEQIASKKRSEYRRRYALLDSIAEQVQRVINNMPEK